MRLLSHQLTIRTVRKVFDSTSILVPDSIMNPVSKAKWNALSRAVEVPFQEELGTEEIAATRL